MPRDEAEASLLPLLGEAASTDATGPLSLLAALRRPWSPSFARGYLTAIRAVVRRRTDNVAYQWVNTLGLAGLALPREAFAAALEPWAAAGDQQGECTARPLAER